MLVTHLREEVGIVLLEFKTKLTCFIVSFCRQKCNYSYLVIFCHDQAIAGLPGLLLTVADAGKLVCSIQSFFTR